MNVLHGIELVLGIMMGLIIAGAMIVVWYTFAEMLHWVTDGQRSVAKGIVLLFIAIFIIGCFL